MTFFYKKSNIVSRGQKNGCLHIVNPIKSLSNLNTSHVEFQLVNTRDETDI